MVNCIVFQQEFFCVYSQIIKNPQQTNLLFNPKKMEVFMSLYLKYKLIYHFFCVFLLVYISISISCQKQGGTAYYYRRNPPPTLVRRK